MYGMPQANAYGAYGFTGYAGFPNAAGGTDGDGAGAVGAQATAGMGQHAMMPGVGGAADPAMPAANPWGTDQTAAAQQAYYNQYYSKLLRVLSRMRRLTDVKPFRLLQPSWWTRRGWRPTRHVLGLRHRLASSCN